MQVIKATLRDLETKTLCIGFQGENIRAQMELDCSEIFAEYPNATPSLIVKPFFGEAYPVVVDRVGTDVVWLITAAVLSFRGEGEIQLHFYKGEVIAKSYVGKIKVRRSLEVTGEMPDPVAQWVDDANAKLAEVDAAIVSIDEMDAVASGLPEGAEPTVEVSMVDDHKRLSFGIPKGDTGEKGDKGDKGDRGEVGATPQMGIGQVSTLPAGSEATASMSGTAENPLLNLGIPKGDKGDKGEQGEKGDKGDTGATGAQGPKGDKGDRGEKGDQGEQGIQGIQGIQGQKGDKGDQGETGPQGEKGEKGDQGDSSPVGGLTDQVLAKASDTDHDTKWMHVAPVIKNEASGAIASFADGADGHPVDELKVQIEPVQDLHGYDHPWPGGGGKNLFPPIQTTTNNGVTFSQDGNYININGTANANAYVTIFNGILPSGTYVINGMDGASNSSWRIGVKIGADSWQYNSTAARNLVSDGETEINIALFAYPAYGAFNNVKVQYQLEMGESETDYEPYSNICPITGWDGVKVTRTGKNLLGGNALELAIKNGASDWNSYPDDRRIRFSGAGDTKPPFSNGLKFKENTQYTFIMTFYKTSVTNSNMVVRYTDGGYDYIPNHSSDLRTKETLVLVTQAGKTIKGFEKVNAGGYTHLYYDESGIFEGVLTADDFVPYEGESYDITFPTEAGTVYGGTLDAATGELVVDRVSITLTGQENFVKASESINAYYAEILTGHKKAIQVWSDRYLSTDVGSAVNMPDLSIKSNASNTSTAKRLYIRDDRYSTVEDFKASVIGTQVLYELATPQTYQLAPVQITTLLGQNNIWADAGNVAVTYNADTKTYVDSKEPEVPVQDVQVNGVSVLQDGVANVPVAGPDTLGVVKYNSNGVSGVTVNASGQLAIVPATLIDVKAGLSGYKPIVPYRQDASTFYGLAKAAGDTTQSASSNVVGQYTDEAKDKIMAMLGILDLIAPYESTGVATRAYSTGDCFIQGGKLYRATASISIGVSFSASNCEQTTLMAEITR